MKTGSIQRKTVAFIILLLAAATIAAYWPVHNHPFIHFDDQLYVTQNYHVQQGVTLKNIIWAFSPSTSRGDEKVYWHPLTWISHMADCELFGLNPHMHHLTNLFFHVINVILLFLVLFMATGEAWKSAFVAALFALHPINVDSVAWIAERKNLLSTTFWITTMLAYVYYARRPSVTRYLLICLSMVLGLLSKPMLATLPCALLLMDYWPLNRVRWGPDKQSATTDSNNGTPKPSFSKASSIQLILEKIPLLAFSAVVIGISMLSLRSKAQVINAIIAPIPIRIENAFVSYVAYLYQTVWPKNLAIFYPFPHAIAAWKVIGSILLLAVITFLVLRRSRKQPYLVIGWFWYLGVLFPVSGLVQGGLWPAMADRWAYVPLIGIFIMFAWGLPDLFPQKLRYRNKMLSVISVCILLLCFLATRRQLSYWSNTSMLFSHAISVTKGNYIAYNIVGEELANKGKDREARQYFLKALRIKNDFPEALKNLGALAAKQGEYKKAIDYYNSALMIAPLEFKTISLLAEMLQKAGMTEQAIAQYRNALGIAPDSPQLHNNLGVVLFEKGKLDEAASQFKTALRLNPQYAEAYYNYGLTAAKQGKTDVASDFYKKAIQIKPDYAEAHKSLADILFGKRDLKEALFQYEAAVRINPDDAKSLYNIGVILYIQKHPEKAIVYFKKALKADPNYEKARIALIQIGNMMRNQN